MPRLAALLFAIVLLAALLGSGCGGSSSTESTPPVEQRPGASGGAPPGAAARSCDTHAEDVEALRATAIACGRARRVMYAWQRRPACALADDASRGSCLIRPYRCQSLRAGHGLAVSCARAGESIAFLAQRR